MPSFRFLSSPPTPPRHPCTQETTQEWRTAQAEAVRAEQEARRAGELACQVDVTAGQAAAAKGIRRALKPPSHFSQDQVQGCQASLSLVLRGWWVEGGARRGWGVGGLGLRVYPTA